MNIAAKIVLFLFIASSVTIVAVFNSQAEKITKPDRLKFHPLVPFYSDLMFLSCVILISYVFEVILEHYEIKIPYIVFANILGFVCGIFMYYNEIIRHAIHFLKINPRELALWYFPMVITNSLLSLDLNILLKIFPQSIIVGIPVSLLTACLYGILVKFLVGPSWYIAHGILFGVINVPIYVKVTSPLLRQQSAHTQQISVLIEGEGLFVFAITDIGKDLIFGYLRGIVLYWYQFLCLSLRLISFGLLTGFLFGYIGRYLIRKLYPDRWAIVLLSVAVPHFAYVMAIKYVAGSGIISVLVVGIMMAVERTLMLQDVEKKFENFFVVICRFMYIVIELMSGMINASRLTPYRELSDYAFVIVIYVLYYLVRFFCFLIFYPAIKRLGYGMDTKTLIVCVWCGTKSIFSLIIILTFESESFDVGITEIFLFYSIGLHILSLAVNISSTDCLLNFLGLKQVSLARQSNMNNCMRHIYAKRERTISILKLDKFLSDTNWPLVIEATTLTHPYSDLLETGNIDSFHHRTGFSFCTNCQKNVQQELTPKELEETTKSAFMRILKAKRMSYQRQYANGMVSKKGIKMLDQTIDFAMHSQNPNIEMEELHKKLISENFFVRFIRKQAEKIRKRNGQKKVRRPQTYWRRVCYHLIVTNHTFDKVILGIITFHFILSGIELYHFRLFHHPHEKSMENILYHYFDYFLLSAEIAFVFVYSIEIVIRILAFSQNSIWSNGCRIYFKSFFNIADVLALMGLIVHVSLSFIQIKNNDIFIIGGYRQTSWGYAIISTIYLRIFTFLRLLQFSYFDMIYYFDKKLDLRMTFNYELGKCYVTAENEILNMMPYILDNKKIKEDIKLKMDTDRIFVTKLLGTIQKERPWTAITVKTKQAIWTILSCMTESLNHLKHTGWVDAYEHQRLTTAMTVLYKNVNNIKKVDPCPPKIIFKEVAWMEKQDVVTEFLFENVVIKTFDPDDIVFAKGDIADGIYIVVTGMLVLKYKPNERILEDLKHFGQLPVVDYLADATTVEPHTDDIVAGNCVGQLSTLTNRPYDCVVSAESHSQVYVLPNYVLTKAMEISSDPVKGLECRIWKDTCFRLVLHVLLDTPAYQTMSRDQVEYALEQAFVPDLHRFKIFVASELIEDIVLIQGIVLDFDTKDVYVAPCCIPRTIHKIILHASSLMTVTTRIPTKLLIIPVKDVDEYEVMEAAEAMCELVRTKSSSKCLLHKVQDRLKKNKQKQIWKLESKVKFGFSD